MGSAAVPSDPPHTRDDVFMSDDPQSIYVAERFRSLQGEGAHSGLPCLFVRLSGCNLSCAYCDTPYARVRSDETRRLTVREVVERLCAEREELVCITGGEPLLQRGSISLMEALTASGKKVILETNGSLDLSPVPPEVVKIVDVKGPGSGMEPRNRYENLALLRATDEVKFVITGRDDFEFAAQIVDRHHLEDGPQVLVSAALPELGPRELGEWLLASRRPWRLNLQLHKVLWPDKERGV